MRFTKVSRSAASRGYRASGMIDVMVAITLIGIMSTAALSLIRSSERGEQHVEKQSTANDLALDAFAALQIIRDTNYLRFASDTDNCWNKLEVTDVADCSDGSAEALTEGSTYYLVQDFDDSPFGEWHLYEVAADEDATIDLYTMNGLPWYGQSGITNTSFTLEQSGVFERTITIAYGDLDGDGTDDYYDATVTLTWEDRSSSNPRSLTKTGSINHIY